MLLGPRRLAETYDASLSFRSAMHFQTIYFADAGRGVRYVSSNGGRTDRSYMSRFSGQLRWHHIAQSTPDRSIAFAATVHGASAHSACSPGRDTASSVTVGWANRIPIANRHAPVRRPLKNRCGRALRWEVYWRCFRRLTQLLPGSRFAGAWLPISIRSQVGMSLPWHSIFGAHTAFSRTGWTARVFLGLRTCCGPAGF